MEWLIIDLPVICLLRTEDDRPILQPADRGSVAQRRLLVLHACSGLGWIRPRPHGGDLHHQLEKQRRVSHVSITSVHWSVGQSVRAAVETGFKRKDLFLFRSFISYTMAVIAVNFLLPLSVMFYCYYNVSVTVRRHKTSNCLDRINIDWSDQMDVTKVTTEPNRVSHFLCCLWFSATCGVQLPDCRSMIFTKQKLFLLFISFSLFPLFNVHLNTGAHALCVLTQTLAVKPHRYVRDHRRPSGGRLWFEEETSTASLCSIA